jgi:hypothetical protein
MLSVCGILRENTADLRMTTTKLKFVPQKKFNRITARQIAQLNFTLCDPQGL